MEGCFFLASSVCFRIEPRTTIPSGLSTLYLDLPLWLLIEKCPTTVYFGGLSSNEFHFLLTLALVRLEHNSLQDSVHYCLKFLWIEWLQDAWTLPSLEPVCYHLHLLFMTHLSVFLLPIFYTYPWLGIPFILSDFLWFNSWNILSLYIHLFTSFFFFEFPPAFRLREYPSMGNVLQKSIHAPGIHPGSNVTEVLGV